MHLTFFIQALQWNTQMDLVSALAQNRNHSLQLRRDPDLAPLRATDKFEGLLKRFEPGGFLGPLLKGFGG